jgi:hypothetical protein
MFRRKKKPEALTDKQRLVAEWLKQVWIPTHERYPNRQDSHYEESVRSAAAYMDGDYDLSLRIASHEE